MAVATLTPGPARAERWRAQVAGIIPRVSLMTTKGVISTDPLGVAGRATCRPFGDGLVSTHPIPFGNISLTAKTERNTSPFHGLHDGDKGGGFNPHPFAWQAEPWLLAVSRVSMMTLVRTAFLTCASQAPLRSAHFVTMLHVTCYNKVVPYCAGWAYRKYIVYIIYTIYFLHPPNSGFQKKVRTYGRCLL